jgi:hypothetical protein
MHGATKPLSKELIEELIAHGNLEDLIIIADTLKKTKASYDLAEYGKMVCLITTRTIYILNIKKWSIAA